MDREISVTVRLTRDSLGRMRVATDPPGLVPDDADVETAFLMVGSGMIRMLGPVAYETPSPRFARRGRTGGSASEK